VKRNSGEKQLEARAVRWTKVKSFTGELRPLVGWGALLCVACESPLPGRPGVAAGGAETMPDASRPPHLRFEPLRAADAVSSITRITVELGGPVSDPRVMLVAGALSASQLRDFARPTIPQTLASRAISAVVWADVGRFLVVVAPLVPLEQGALYSVALSAPLVSLPFTVSAEAPAPVLARLWPDHDETMPSASAAVWCGAEKLGPLDIEVTLEPASIAGRFTLGTGSPIPTPRCVNWSATRPAPLVSDLRAPQALAPPSLTFDDGSSAALELTLLWSREVAPASAPICGPQELLFGLGCAEVEDDRVIVRSADDPLLWTIDQGGESLVRPTRTGTTFSLRPLPSDGRYRIDTLDLSGRVTADDVTVTPAPPRPHLVLNEVMANPAGSEPAQEWVELFNDGSDAVLLAGFAVEDSGGRTALPDGVLAPGAFALVVPEAYVPDDGFDPSPVEGTLILRVPALGRSGLTNDGERLTLRDPAGVAISIFPAIKTKNGVSIARLTPDALDTDPASFELSRNGTATPGASNVDR